MSFDPVQIKWPCRLPFVPGFAQTDVLLSHPVSILMVNHHLLELKCGNTVATSCQNGAPDFREIVG
jgi:hypothetical protein